MHLTQLDVPLPNVTLFERRLILHCRLTHLIRYAPNWFGASYFGTSPDLIKSLTSLHWCAVKLLQELGDCQ